ncbi:hypothetical protein JB92DRAFT_2834564 [Gautieria morchelliformis]|nr:hypothetical protein JB92DRAFT_2834564 [Gautieria morchelliformis]
MICALITIFVFFFLWLTCIVARAMWQAPQGGRCSTEYLQTWAAASWCNFGIYITPITAPAYGQYAVSERTIYCRSRGLQVDDVLLQLSPAQTDFLNYLNRRDEPSYSVLLYHGTEGHTFNTPYGGSIYSNGNDSQIYSFFLLCGSSPMMEEIVLINLESNQKVDITKPMEVTKFLKSWVNVLIDKANAEWDERNEASVTATEKELSDAPSSPTQGGYDRCTRDAQSCTFRTRVRGENSESSRCPSVPSKKAAARGGKVVTDEPELSIDDPDMPVREKLEKIREATLVMEYLAAQELQLLGENGMSNAIQTFVDKDDIHSIFRSLRVQLESGSWMMLMLSYWYSRLHTSIYGVTISPVQSRLITIALIMAPWIMLISFSTATSYATDIKSVGVAIGPASQNILLYCSIKLEKCAVFFHYSAYGTVLFSTQIYVGATQTSTGIRVKLVNLLVPVWVDLSQAALPLVAFLVLGTTKETLATLAFWRTISKSRQTAPSGGDNRTYPLTDLQDTNPDVHDNPERTLVASGKLDGGIHEPLSEEAIYV